MYTFKSLYQDKLYLKINRTIKTLAIQEHSMKIICAKNAFILTHTFACTHIRASGQLKSATCMHTRKHAFKGRQEDGQAGRQKHIMRQRRSTAVHQDTPNVLSLERKTTSWTCVCQHPKSGKRRKSGTPQKFLLAILNRAHSSPVSHFL